MRTGRMSRGVLLGFCLALASPVRAQETPPAQLRAVIVGMAECCPGRQWDELEGRMRHELALLDFEVQEVAGSATTERAQQRELARLARDQEAELAVRVGLHEELPGVELWFVQPRLGDAGKRYLPTYGGTDDEAASIAALKAIEVIRSRQLQAHEARETARGTRTPASSRLRLDAGPALLASPGGVGPRVAVRVGAAWSPVEAASLRLATVFSVAGGDIQNTDGNASLSLALVRAQAGWELARRGPVRAALLLGGGVITLRSQGESATHAELSDRTTTGVLGGGVEIHVVPSRHVWIRLGLDVGVLVPEVAVQFAGEPVATLGMPLVEGSVGVTVALP